MNKGYLGFAIFFLSCIGLLVGTSIFAWQDMINRYNDFNKTVAKFETTLNSHDWQLQKAIIRSPAVIIPLSTEAEFIAKCTQLKATIIYTEGGTIDQRIYYIFTPDYTIAYAYTIRVTKPTW